MSGSSEDRRRDEEILQAFRDLASGRGVRRGRHELRVEGRDLSALFRQALEEEGFQALTVGEAPVELGEKAPAFLVREGRADFGWIFWEKFREGRARKLFGSVVRNRKGDWDVQLGAGSREPLYIDVSGKVSVDSDRPSEVG
jgi:hypothetical protein